MMSEAGPELPGLDPKLYYSIREVADYTGVKAHVLRYWEQEFPTLRPKKNRAGNRSYRPRDIEEILKIRKLLYEDGFKIDGARKLLKGGPEKVEQISLLGDEPEKAARRAKVAELKREVTDLLEFIRKA
jgi:DNA-binding transcriptional MerR regulator